MGGAASLPADECQARAMGYTEQQIAAYKASKGVTDPEPHKVVTHVHDSAVALFHYVSQAGLLAACTPLQ